MGRRIKAYKINKKYLFIGVAIAVVSLAVVLLTSLTITSCRNPLMDVIESSGISVRVDGKVIQPGGSYDLGPVKQGGSYEATFTIVNSGNQDLKLTGSPDLVRIEGGAAGMFIVSQEPANVIKVRSDSSFVLSYSPIGEGQTDIQLRIDNNSKKDDFAFDLTSYVDGTDPTIVDKFPQGTGKPRNVVVSARFSEDMDFSTIDDTAFTLTGSVSGSVSSTVSYNAATRTAYLDPIVDLSPTEWHTVALSTSSITDLAGNLLFDAGGGIWVFQTGTVADTDPPQVDADSTVPANGATEVAKDTVVSATFDEDVEPSTLSTDTFKLLDGAAEVEGSVVYSAATKTATFTPDSDLDPSTVYTARLTAGIEDTIGNATTSPYYEWTFTTEAGVDNTAPQVSSSSVNPPSGANNVPTNTIISVLFNEAIDDATLTTSTFTLTDAMSGPVAAQGDSIVYDSNSMTAAFIPASDLTGGRLHTVTLTSGIADEAGNHLSPYSWTFTTGAGTDSIAPTVSSTSPANSDTDVPVDAAITATFSEAMDATTISTSTFKLLEDGVDIEGAVSYNGSTFKATFTPVDDLDEARVFTARITTGAKDSAANPLASQYEWSFTTAAGSTPPEVVDVVPEENAIDVDLSPSIVVEFSKLMDDMTITISTFKVSEIVGGIPGSPIAGSVSYDDTTREATFTPSSTLTGDIDYLIECTSTMTDIGGKALTYFSSIFTTVGNNWNSMIWDKGKWAPD